MKQLQANAANGTSADLVANTGWKRNIFTQEQLTFLQQKATNYPTLMPQMLYAQFLVEFNNVTTPTEQQVKNKFSALKKKAAK